MGRQQSSLLWVRFIITRSESSLIRERSGLFLRGSMMRSQESSMEKKQIHVDGAI